MSAVHELFGCKDCTANCETCGGWTCATEGPALIPSCEVHPTCEKCDDGTNTCTECARERRES